MRASPGPKPVAVLAERGIDDRLQDLKQGLLDQPIHHRWDAQLPRASTRTCTSKIAPMLGDKKRASDLLARIRDGASAAAYGNGRT